MVAEPGDVLMVMHSRVSEDDPRVRATARVFEEGGRRVRVFRRQAPDRQPGRFDGGWELPGEDLEGVALAVTFGGDGTFLHAARSALEAGVPLLGINLGRLGFLTWTTLEGAPEAARCWLEGGTEVETRATLRVEVGEHRSWAINEAALLKDPAANVIQVEVDGDDEKVGMFHADGVVVATPTGSTAYAASGGGPIVDPRLEALVMVPLNPHTLASRALVLPPSTELRVRVDEATRLILDGTGNIDVPSHSELRCRLDGPPLRVVRCPGSSGFYEQLREKMRWGEPLVREGRR